MRARTEQGGTSTEYALIASLIAGVIVIAVMTLGQASQASWEDSCDRVSTAMGSNCG